MTLFDILEKHALEKPMAIAYIFFDSSGEFTELSYAQLLARVQAIAGQLQKSQTQGDRVLLMYRPGLDFIAAILACFASGMIAVPVQPIHNKRVVARLTGIIENCAANVMLTNSFTQLDLTRIAPNIVNETKGLQWLCSDLVDDSQISGFSRPLVESSSLAFLQYTSGSTDEPKGVMVTHENLMDNLAAIKEAFGHDGETVVSGWLPLYHDMGLIGNVFQPLYLGVTSILFSAMSFLTSPSTWLHAISKWRVTSSGGPDFAYDLCVRQITDEDLEGLDLSCWKVAFNGAEPVRAKVMQEFSKKFSPYGFREESFYPCYGMAEATLFVTGGDPQRKAKLLSVDPIKLSENIVSEDPHGVSLMSCGKAFGENHFQIVDTETLTALPAGRVGEIWIQGPSVAMGYWSRPELSEACFQAHLIDGQGPFLRTGDLGFCFEGELFIKGRLKDLIIVRGQNHYPDDIEATVCHSYDGLRPNGVAVFTVNDEEESRLIVVAELERAMIAKLDSSLFQDIFAKIRKEVSEKHGLRINQLKLIRPATLPKTSSGKIRRSHCRNLYERDELELVTEIWKVRT